VDSHSVRVPQLLLSRPKTVKRCVRCWHNDADSYCRLQAHVTVAHLGRGTPFACFRVLQVDFAADLLLRCNQHHYHARLSRRLLCSSMYPIRRDSLPERSRPETATRLALTANALRASFIDTLFCSRRAMQSSFPKQLQRDIAHRAVPKLSSQDSLAWIAIPWQWLLSANGLKSSGTILGGCPRAFVINALHNSVLCLRVLERSLIDLLFSPSRFFSRCPLCANIAISVSMRRSFRL